MDYLSCVSGLFVLVVCKCKVVVFDEYVVDTDDEAVTECGPVCCDLSIACLCALSCASRVAPGASTTVTLPGVRRTVACIEDG